MADEFQPPTFTSWRLDLLNRFSNDPPTAISASATARNCTKVTHVMSGYAPTHESGVTAVSSPTRPHESSATEFYDDLNAVHGTRGS